MKKLISFLLVLQLFCNSNLFAENTIFEYSVDKNSIQIESEPDATPCVWSIKKNGIYIKCDNGGVDIDNKNFQEFRFYDESTTTIHANKNITAIKFYFTKNKKYKEKGSASNVIMDKKLEAEQDYYIWKGNAYTISFKVNQKIGLTKIEIVTGNNQNTTHENGFYWIKDKNQNQYIEAKTATISLSERPSTSSITYIDFDNEQCKVQIQGGFYIDGKYTTDESWNTLTKDENNNYMLNHSNVEFEKIEQVTLDNFHKCKNKYYRTLYLPFAFQVNDNDTKLYTGKLIEDQHSILCLPIHDNIVPAKTPLIIESNKDRCTITLIPNSHLVPPSDNCLSGTLFEYGNNHFIDRDYCLGQFNGKLGMYHWKENTLQANKAYYSPSSMNEKVFPLKFDNTTGIESIINNNSITSQNNTIFNLQGKKVNNISNKGIYIINHQKIIF